MSRDTPDNRKDRQNYRFLAGMRAFAGLGGETVPCDAIDLHRTGVLVEGAFGSGLPREVVVRLESTGGDLSLETLGRVAHQERDEQTGRTRLGIEFGHLTGDEQERLESLLSRVIEGTHPAPIERLRSDASVEEIRAALSKVSLAHKLTFAQRAQTRERGFLMHDENSQVIEAICRNPQLTQPEVLEILKRSDLLTTTVELLSRNSRWTSNENLRVAIATHPRVTFPVAERMVQGLNPVVIRKLLRSPGLNPAIKNKLVKSIPQKHLQGW